uniref:Shugoshin C-terminal domain-containing protein n=1 Tax=Kalanchoe fedtschenkoi TaxID=63787 RepID=A0A7N0T1J7_KALFE
MDNALFVIDELKGKDVGTGSEDGNAERKKLAEITNLPCPPKLSFQIEKNQTVSLSTTNFIHQLQDENMALKKMLVDRNKLLESSRIELYKLRVNLDKVQLQNLQLAQVNSQLLQELNSGKDRLIALQHELGCKNGLLKALTLEAETTKSAEEGVPAQLGTKKEDELRKKIGCSDRKRQSNRQSLSNSVKIGRRKTTESQDSLPRRHSTRLKCDVSQTIKDEFMTDDVQIRMCSVAAGPACESTSGALDESVRKVEAKNKADNQESRRQSKRFRLGATQTSKNLSGTNEIETPVLIATAEAAQNDESDLSISVVKEENIEFGSVTTGSDVSHRHSTGRPLRHAAVRIQSYKEVPVNIKMRRDK